MQCILIYTLSHPFGEVKHPVNGARCPYGRLSPISIGRLTPSNIGRKISSIFYTLFFNCFNDRHKITLNCYFFSVIYGDDSLIFIKHNTTKINYNIIITNISKTDNTIGCLVARVSPPVYSIRDTAVVP